MQYYSTYIYNFGNLNLTKYKMYIHTCIYIHVISGKLSGKFITISWLLQMYTKNTTCPRLGEKSWEITSSNSKVVFCHVARQEVLLTKKVKHNKVIQAYEAAIKVDTRDTFRPDNVHVHVYLLFVLLYHQQAVYTFYAITGEKGLMNWLRRNDWDFRQWQRSEWLATSGCSNIHYIHIQPVSGEDEVRNGLGSIKWYISGSMTSYCDVT